MAAPLPSDLAAQIKYGPRTGGAIRRSEYLSDALRQMSTEGAKSIQSPGELAAKLLATAVLYRAGKRADQDALKSVADQQNAETESALAGLKLPSMAGGLGAPPPAQPQPQPQPQPAPDPAAAPPTMPTAPPPAPVQQQPLASAAYSPEDRDALTRMLAVEAIGEGPSGMAAAGHVALNRLKKGYGGAKSLSDIIHQPHQFEGITRGGQVKPEDYAAAGQVADGILSGQVPDPTNGAMAFLNPDLQVQLGRSIPAWAQGEGQRIGRHVFFGGKPAQQQMASAEPPPPPPPPDPNGPAVQPTAQPYQVASTGQTPPPPPQIPSAPGSSPPADGTPPAALPPQASPAGGTPQGPAMRGITPEQVGYLERLLRDPQTHEVGMQYARELQKKAVEPVEWDVKVQGGFVIATNPMDPSQRIVKPVAELQHKRVSADELGIPAPKGTFYDVSPDNQATALFTPPTGYQVKPSGQQAIQPGGPASIEVERQLRTDFEKAPEVQAYSKAATIYESMKKDFGTKGRIADLNFVYGLATIFDPTSVVREGEQVMIKNAQNLPDWLVGQINRVNGGQGILPETRAQIMETAGTRVGGLHHQVELRSKFNTGIAERYGIDARNVIPTLPEYTPWERPKDLGQGPGQVDVPPAARQAYVGLYNKGRIDTKKPFGDPANPIIAATPEILRGLDRPENRGKHIITPDGQLAVID